MVKHVPVLLQEAVDLLAPKAGGVYVDGTLGAGGHAAEILKRSGPHGLLIGMDQDVEAVERSRKNLAVYGDRVIIRQNNFRDVLQVLSELGFQAVDGVLLDLGVSWFHLKTPERGFSFQQDGPLDMRMDTGLRQSAADLVNTLSRGELARIIREYGEENRAGAIARAIEKARSRGPITRTVQLAEIVSSVFPPRPLRRIHPATLTFQALRIMVNDEMGSLREGLGSLIQVVKPGGRIVVITFHSLEDRIVKQTFVNEAKGCVCPPKMPVCACGRKPVLQVITHRPIMAGQAEVEHNPAARSAKLRAAEKR
jgi:16S rRNA (cytosine1402-N4)-methyltransferase